MIKKDTILSPLKNRFVLLTILFSVIACAYLLLCAVNIIYAFAVLVGCLALFAFSRDADLGFMMYIIILPLSCMPILAGLLPGIIGMKLQVILLIIFAGYFILYKKPHKIMPVLSVLIVIMLGFYAIAWIRSGDYALKAFTDNYAGELPVFSYITQYVAWTVTAFIPLISIACFYRDSAGIDKLLKTLAVSVILLLGCLIFIYLFKITDRSDFEVIRSAIGGFTGLHGNDFANFCILSFPVIMAWALYKKSFLALFTLALIITGTLLCFSRTAYFILPAGFFLYVYFSGKLKWIPLIAIVLGLAVYFLLPGMVVDRAVTGIGTGNYDELTSGRLEYIWKPLLAELADSPGVLLFGSGRFGIIDTAAWQQGRMSLVTHAHNMYLDCILDMGIAGLLVFLAFFAVVIVWFRRIATRYRTVSPYHAGLLDGCTVSVVCYLLSGLTGRSFFPSASNIYLWIVIGLGIAIAEYLKREGAVRLVSLRVLKDIGED